MKMISAIILSVLVVSINTSVVRDSPLARRYDPAEENPNRIRYLPYRDEATGELRIEDLQRPVDPSFRGATAQDVTFHLFTATNANAGETIHATNFAALKASKHYKATGRKNVFISHGWNNNHQSSVNVNVRGALMATHSDLNVFVVDWSGPANEFYTTAKSAVPDVGKVVGEWIDQMIKEYAGLTAADFMLIGHSLGAHVVGCAGAAIKSGQVDYIVGLDPASPLYTMGNTDNRLDASDARFVAVVHTNGGLLGFSSSIGDADYYPNGGNWQDGCGLDATGSCAHSRAHQYMGESIRAKTGFTAWKCGSYKDFEKGQCTGNAVSFMGRFNVDKNARGDFYLTTKTSQPFSMV